MRGRSPPCRLPARCLLLSWLCGPLLRLLRLSRPLPHGDLPAHEDRGTRAEILNRAHAAPGLPRDTDPPAVEDEQVREADPLLARDRGHEVLLHVLDLLRLREPEPAREAVDVRVHHDP